MAKAVITQAVPSQYGQPQVNLRKDDFDAAIFSKGYEVYIDKALRCPCRVKGAGNSPLPTCKNCGGLGWAFINRFKTRLLLHSMNMNTKYKEWSEENIGRVSISSLSTDRLSYMDKITLIDAETTTNQIVHLKEKGDKCFAFLAHDAKRIEEAFMFVETDQPLLRLIEGIDFTVEKDLIYFDQIKFGGAENTAVIKYVHSPQFIVKDLVRETITQYVKNEKDKDVPIQYPVSAIGERISNYLIEPNSLSGTDMIDNSYEV